MMACWPLRALLVQQWSAAAAPKDGHLTMVVDGSDGVARWRRFFRPGVRVPVRSLDLELRGELQPSYSQLLTLVRRLCECFAGSLRELRIGLGIADAAFVCISSALEDLELRQLTLELPTSGYHNMLFNLDLRWGCWGVWGGCWGVGAAAGCGCTAGCRRCWADAAALCPCLRRRKIRADVVGLQLTGSKAAYLHDLQLHPAVRRLDLYCDSKVRLNRPSRFCTLREWRRSVCAVWREAVCGSRMAQREQPRTSTPPPPTPSAAAVADLPNLRELCVLNKTNLGCEELRALQLTRLCLCREFADPDMGQDGAPTDLLPATLSELELCEQRWSAPALAMDDLSRLTALTRLSLANCSVSHDAATLGCLTRLARLRELDISAPASPATLSPLTALRSLTFLHFTVTPSFADPAAAWLRGEAPDTLCLSVLKRLAELHIVRADFETPAQEALFDAFVNWLPPVRVTVLDM